ncbi:MAG: hypothetical protein ACTSUO_00765 [Candidatus Thorarchaeota archaeon]
MTNDIDDLKVVLNSIFFGKIREYNEKEQFCEHYVRIPKKYTSTSQDLVMVIKWNGSWKYSVYYLEEVE